MLPLRGRHMPDRLVPIATFVTPAQAAAARSALEAQGIASFLRDDNLVGMNWLLGNAVGYVKLLVSEPDAQRARALLETPFDDWPATSSAGSWKCPHCGEENDTRRDHCQRCGQTRSDARPNDTAQEAFMNRLQADDDNRQATNPYASPRSDVADGETDDRSELDDGPEPQVLCPACGRPRTAVCPYCRTSGTRFRIADTFGADMAEEPLLLCPTCDEPFEASYVRVCEGCGHHFDSGVEAPDVVKESTSEPLNWRVLLVGLGGVILIVGLVSYFAILVK